MLATAATIDSGEPRICEVNQSAKPKGRDQLSRRRSRSWWAATATMSVQRLAAAADVKKRNLSPSTELVRAHGDDPAKNGKRPPRIVRSPTRPHECGTNAHWRERHGPGTERSPKRAADVRHQLVNDGGITVDIRLDHFVIPVSLVTTLACSSPETYEPINTPEANAPAPIPSGAYTNGPVGSAPTAPAPTAPTTPPAPTSSPTAAAVCDIVGGAGAKLANAVTTRGDCDLQCASTSVAHPNLRCVWNQIDITPTGSCSLKGGAGAALFDGVVSRGKCYETCLTTAVAHPNLRCVWGAIDVTPVGACSIVGGLGAQLATATESHGDCFTRCQSLQAAHPNEVCSWNGVKIN